MSFASSEQAERLAVKAEGYLQQVEDAFVHEADGLLYNWINRRTGRPFEWVDLPDDIVYRCRPGMPDALTWVNNENTLFKTGHYLSAMSTAYGVTGDERYLHLARRCVDAFYELHTLTGQLFGQTGWLPKAFGWLPKCAYSHDMNFDQTGPLMDGLLDYYDVAEESEQARAREIIKAVADMLMRWDYNVRIPGTLGMSGGDGPLLDTPNINEQVPILHLLLAAGQVTGNDKYVREYERVQGGDYKGNLQNYTRVQMNEMLKAGTLKNAAALTGEVIIMPPMDAVDAAGLEEGEDPGDYVYVGGGWHQSFESGRYLVMHDPDQQRREHYRKQVLRWYQDEISSTYVPEFRAGYLYIYYNPSNGKYCRVKPRLLDVPKVRRNFLSYCKGTWLHTGDLWALGALDAWEMTGDDSAGRLSLEHLLNTVDEDFVWIKDPYNELPSPSRYLADCDFGPVTWLMVYWRARAIGFIV